MRRRSTRVVRAVALLAAGLFSMQLHAQQSVKVDLPAQPLAESLRQLAFASNTNIVFDPTWVAGMSAPAFSGTATAEEVLVRLLSGTRLRYKFVDEKTVSLMPPGNAMKTTAAGVGSPSAAADGRMRLAQANEAPLGGGESSRASDPSQGLEEIVVTAQKRTERLIDAPISVGVLSGNDLDRSSSRSIADALNQVGGVALVEETPGNARIAIRGVMPGVGTSTAGYYLDEVPFAFITTSQLPDANAFDLARVEVLRGPQGTLYGVNAMSGVVRVLTNDANLDTFEAKARARTSDTKDGGTNYGGDLAVNVPLVEGVLAARAVASYADSSGFINSSLDGARHFNDSEARAYRLKTTYTPSDNLSIKLGWSRSELDSGGPAYSLDEDLVTQFSSEQQDERVYDTYNLIAEYQWQSVSLLSSTAYVDYRAQNHPELLLGGGARLNYLNQYELASFSQEFRLSSQLSGPWRWSAGAIYKDTEQEQVQDATPTFPFPYRVREQSESYAVFGELTRAFGDDRFELTAGVRYADDRLLSTQQSDFFGGTDDVVAAQRGDFDQLTGRVVLAYKPRANTTLYGSISSGFRSGINQTPAVLLRDPRFGGVDPDSLMNYEVGAKGSLFGGTVTFDTAVYYTSWDDVQQSLVLPVGFEARINAGEANGFGFDGSVAYQPFRALTLQATVGWNGLEFAEDIRSRGVTLFAKGERVNRSPQTTGSLGGTYRIETPVSGMDVVLSSNLSYRSSTVLRYLSGNELTQTESEVTRNWKANLGLEFERWSVALFGDNLLDERGALEPADPNAGLNSLRQRPRTIGLQAACNF